MTQKGLKLELPESYKYVAVMLTMRCNLDCSFCLNAFSKTFNRERFMEISGEQWVYALNRIKSRKDVPITLSGGEPSLHSDFVEIIKGIKPDLGIDILTNLHWGKKTLNRFLSEINPDRINRDSPYPSIRVSYHPEQMKNPEFLVNRAKKIKDAGFNIGIYAVQYPAPENLEAITQMQFFCKNNGLDFRIKDFTGKYKGVDDLGNSFEITYGNYSKYPDSAFNEKTKTCLCKNSELLIGTNAKVYRCHRDLFAEEYSVGNILDEDYNKIEDIFRECLLYGKCHPCDVKVKTNFKQELGHTSVEIKDVG